MPLANEPNVSIPNIARNAEPIFVNEPIDSFNLFVASLALLDSNALFLNSMLYNFFWSVAN